MKIAHPDLGAGPHDYYWRLMRMVKAGIPLRRARLLGMYDDWEDRAAQEGDE